MTSSPGAEEAYLLDIDAPPEESEHSATSALANMSSTDPEERILDAPFEDFATSVLPLYSGPQVTIRIGSPSHEYKLSKALLCEQSPYFAATFRGNTFLEGEEQSTTLTEIDDVVSVRSVQLLIQWLYRGKVSFGALDPRETITAAIEFVRFADMCGVTGVGTPMAEQIKAIIKKDARPGHRLADAIDPGLYLPEGHPVQRAINNLYVEYHDTDLGPGEMAELGWEAYHNMDT